MLQMASGQDTTEWKMDGIFGLLTELCRPSAQCADVQQIVKEHRCSSLFFFFLSQSFCKTFDRIQVSGLKNKSLFHRGM